MPSALMGIILLFILVTVARPYLFYDFEVDTSSLSGDSLREKEVKYRYINDFRRKISVLNRLGGFADFCTRSYKVKPWHMRLASDYSVINHVRWYHATRPCYSPGDSG